MITPMDIQKREFRTSLKGYDKKEVEEFMDMIAESYARQMHLVDEYKSKLKKEQEELSKYKVIERTLSETLIIAQKTSDELLGAAKEKEEILIKNAESKADEIIQEKNQMIKDLDREIFKLKNDYENFKSKIETMLISQLKSMEASSISSTEE